MSDRTPVSRRRLATILALTVALGGSAWAQPASVQLGSGLALPFVATDDPETGTTAYQIDGLAGTLRLTTSGIGLDLGVAEDQAAVSATLHFVDADPLPTLVADTPWESVTHRLIGRDPSSWQRGQPHHGGVRYDHLYPGISFRFTADARRLRGTLHVDPGADPDWIGWRIADGTPRLDEARGLFVDLETDEGLRTLRFRPPSACQPAAAGCEPIAAAYTLADGVIGVAVTGHDSSRPLEIESWLTYAPHIGAADTITTASGVALCGTARTTTTSDAWIARFGDDGTTLRSITVTGGSGEDTCNGLATSEDGGILLTGSTASTDLPLADAAQPSLAGGSDALVMQLTTDGSKLRSSSYLGGPGDDAGHDLAVTTKGTIAITGLAGEGFPRRGRGTFTTRLPRETAGGQGEYFLSELSENGATLATSQLFTGTIVGRPIRLTVERGRPVAGVLAQPLGTQTTLCYEMVANDATNDYTNPVALSIGFGYFGLQWKHYQTNIPYDQFQAIASGNVPIGTLAPVAYPAAWQAADLTGVQQTVPTVFDTLPGGTWLWESENNAYDQILAPLFFLARWETPVFVNRVVSGNNYATAIRKYVVDPLNAGTYPTVEDLCDFSVADYDDVTCTGGLSFFLNFAIDEVHYAQWGPSYTPNNVFTWNGSWSWDDEFIYDPPAGDEGFLDYIQAALPQVRATFGGQGELVTTTYEAGKAIDVTVEPSTFSVVDLLLDE